MLEYKYNTDIYKFNFDNDFFKHGYYDRDITYEGLISYLYGKIDSRTMKGDQIVRDITFQVTDACNLACSYCYQINKAQHVMPFEVAKKFIDMLLMNEESMKAYMDTRNSRGATIDFIGGEPFLQIELIDQIIDYFEKQVILLNHPWQYFHMYSMSTNGTLYFEPKVQEFLKKHYKHLSLSISIDGNKKLHDSCRKFPDGTGSYDIAMAAVKHYRETYHQNVGSKMTIAPQNVSYVFEALTSMIENGYHAISLNCIYEKGWTKADATILYGQLKAIANYIFANNLESVCSLSLFKKDSYVEIPRNDDQNWCGGNGNMIAIDYKGDIYPCLRYMESSLGNTVPPIIIGNVNRGILTTEQERYFAKTLQSINRINQSTEECLNCPVARGCAWCQAYNYQDSNEFFHRATYICDMHKATALANSYYWNLFFLKHNIDEVFKIWLPDEDSLTLISQQELNFLKMLADPSLHKNNTQDLIHQLIGSFEYPVKTIPDVFNLNPILNYEHHPSRQINAEYLLCNGIEYHISNPFKSDGSCSGGCEKCPCKE